MELSSSDPPDKLNNLNKPDTNALRDKDELSPLKAEDSHEQMSQRCVIIKKDEKGYGLIVSGDNPVFVQSVKDDGAAARAGVQQGDRIIKVNGTLVTQSNHQDVVELIKSGSHVALTLLGRKPTGHGRTMSGTLQPLNISGGNVCSSYTIPGGRLSSSSDRITGPQPVDPEKQQQLTNSRIHTIRKMLEKEVMYLEKLKADFSKTPSDKIHAEVNGAMKRVKTLEDQLHNLTGISHDQILPKSPKSPPTSHLRHYHSEKENRHMSGGYSGHNLTHQVSAPTLPPKPEHLIKMSHAKANHTHLKSPVNSTPSEIPHGGTASPDSRQSLSASLEDIDKHVSCRTTTWPQVSPTHSRQSSGSNNVMKSLRHHKVGRSNTSDVLCRSHSEASQHFCKTPLAETLSPTEVNSSQRGHSFKDISGGPHESSTESPGGSPSHSPPEYAEIADISEGYEADDMSHEEYGTPPENSYMEISMQSVIGKLSHNPSIMCMDDDDFSSESELAHLNNHGPYNGLFKLVRHPAHLAVFLHYLLSNGNSSSLFFYLISEIYEQGTVKDMKKWAYEIHSSFLVPAAPLKVVTVDEAILHEIDGVLLNHIDKEDMLRTVFRKAREKARQELNSLLAEFRNNRIMGLANIFSPPDHQLEEAENKNKEIVVIEQILLPYFDNLQDDYETMNDALAARTYALATILKQYGPKSTQAINIVDRCPTFVAKEKSRFRLLQRNKKIMLVNGHNFVPQHYYCVTYCNHCQFIIWGVGDQGYQCQNCDMNIHKSCVKVVEEHCIGALKKDKRRDRKSGLMENLISIARKPSQPVPSAIEKAKRLNDEMSFENESYISDSQTTGNFHESGGVDGKCDGKPFSEASYALHLQNDLERLHYNKKNAGIGRSESFRQRRESRPSFRKRSDPNIPRSKSDVEVDDKSNLNHSGSSSNSSLSNRSLDSPSTSSDMVHRTPNTTTDSVPPCSTAAANVPSPLATTPSNANSHDDSDLDTDVDPPNWQENLDLEALRLMKPKEKKRQDVINELFHTERTHVRNLKVLDRIFYKPLVQEQLLSPDLLQLLFPNLEEMIEIHGSFNTKMKSRRKEESIVGDIGVLLLEMFDGIAGEHFKKAAALFCQNQSIALESLKLKQKKDQKLSMFLSDAELHNLCRRLQLKDIIASGFQRLTKYPLLLENIAKYTPPNTQEHSNLIRAVELSKEILKDVDTAVKEAENLHRLTDIHKKLEKSSFEKVDHKIVKSFKNLDVTKHKLVHEGQLTWRLNKQKTVDIHVVLLEDILVLLQKQDEKYILKFHNTNLATGREDTKIMYSPILRVQNLLIRNNATDKRSIFLISSSELHAMYEFVASTASEKKIWCRYLTEAIEINGSFIGRSPKQPELPHLPTDNAVPSEEVVAESTLSNNKESQCKEEARGGKISNVSIESTDSGQTSFDATESTPASATEPSEVALTTPQPLSPDDHSLVVTSSRVKSQARFQRVEMLKVEDCPQLIEPSEVIISHRAVLQTAEPVLTPIERLRRKDQEIANAILEKEKLVGHLLQMSGDGMQQVVEDQEDSDGKTAHILTLASIHQANQLSLLISGCLNVTSEDIHSAEGGVGDAEASLNQNNPGTSRKAVHVPVATTDKLLSVSSSLNKKLTQLLSVITEVEDERRQLRKELMSTREQIHLMHDPPLHGTIRSQSPSNPSHSRPNSFISTTSSVSEDAPEAAEEPQLPTVLNSVVEEVDFKESSKPPMVKKDSNNDVPLEIATCNANEMTTTSDDGEYIYWEPTLPPPTPLTDLDCDEILSSAKQENSDIKNVNSSDVKNVESSDVENVESSSQIENASRTTPSENPAYF